MYVISKPEAEVHPPRTSLKHAAHTAMTFLNVLDLIHKPKTFCGPSVNQITASLLTLYYSLVYAWTKKPSAQIDTYLRVPDTIGVKMNGYFRRRRKFLSTAV